MREFQNGSHSTSATVAHASATPIVETPIQIAPTSSPMTHLNPVRDRRAGLSQRMRGFFLMALTGNDSISNTPVQTMTVRRPSRPPVNSAARPPTNPTLSTP